MIKMHPIALKKGKRLTPEALRDSVEANKRKIAQSARQDFQATTATWSTDVEFTTRYSAEAVEVFTTNQIYAYGNRGTAPHQITIRNAPRLSFQTAYTAKTRPRFIGSQGGGSSGPRAFALTVNHPGTKARSWTVVIAEERGKEFADGIRADLRKLV